MSMTYKKQIKNILYNAKSNIIFENKNALYICIFN